MCTEHIIKICFVRTYVTRAFRLNGCFVMFVWCETSHGVYRSTVERRWAIIIMLEIIINNTHRNSIYSNKASAASVNFGWRGGAPNFFRRRWRRTVPTRTVDNHFPLLSAVRAHEAYLNYMLRAHARMIRASMFIHRAQFSVAVIG